MASIRLCGSPQPLANRHFYERRIRYYALVFLLINLNLGKTNIVQLSRIQCQAMTITMQKLKVPAVLSDEHIHVFRTEMAPYLRMYNSANPLNDFRISTGWEHSLYFRLSPN